MEITSHSPSPGQAGPVSPNQASTTLTNGNPYQSSFLTPLPKTRTKPLPYNKELQSRRWIDGRLTHINRRYVRKYGLPEDNGDLLPYTDIEELCINVDEVLNFLWVTATPVLQTQYLLQISHDLISTYIPNFIPSPGPIFSLLRKLDHCFASMLAGRDIDTGEELAAVSHSDGQPLVTLTDMVRLKGIVEQTRVDIVSVFLGEYENDGLPPVEENSRTPKKGKKEISVEDDDYDEDEIDDMDGDTEVEITDTEMDVEEREPELDEVLRMDIARVYENTVVQLGNSLGGAGELGKGISDELGVGESHILQDQSFG